MTALAISCESMKMLQTQKRILD